MILLGYLGLTIYTLYLVMKIFELSIDYTREKELLLWYSVYNNKVRIRKYITIFKF